MSTAQPPNPPSPPSFGDKARSLFMEHWPKAGAWLLGNGISTLDQWWTQFIPIPADLRLAGSIAAAVLTLLAVVASAALVLGWMKPKPKSARWTWLITAAMISAAGVGAFALVFRYVEDWWKKSDLLLNFIYYLVEPSVYGLVFASLAAFTFFLGYLAYDIWNGNP